MFDIRSQMTYQKFELEVNRLKSALAKDTDINGILNGPYIPFIIPKCEQKDIGEAMESLFLPALAKTFQTHLPEYAFTNHAGASLKGKLQPASQGRHQDLVEKVTHHATVGIYFPCLSGFSIEAARQQIEFLPDYCLLSGGFDTTAAFISVPDLLIRKDGYPPLLWFAGLDTDTPLANYHFEAYGYNLTFNRRPHLNNVAEYWSCGITVLA